MAPLLALGLLIFVDNKKKLIAIGLTWATFGLTLLPFVYVYLTQGETLTKRFAEVSIFGQADSKWAALGQMVVAYFQDLSPMFLLVEGDNLARHHVPGMGELLLIPFVTAVIGMALVLLYHRRDRWWLYMIVGVFASIVPGAITVNRHHALRLLVLPMFLSILMVPVLDRLRVRSGEYFQGSSTTSMLKKAAFAAFLLFTLVQAVWFQIQFWREGPGRIFFFNAGYPLVLDRALAEKSRPIYLQDGYWGPGYIHAYWYGAIKGVDPSTFVHLKEHEPPPPGALVLSSERECTGCQKIFQNDAYLLYKNAGEQTTGEPGSAAEVEERTFTKFGTAGSQSGQLLGPRGIAIGPGSKVFVADTQNHRISIFDRDGQFRSQFGTAGTDAGQMQEPNGVVADGEGFVWVTDAGNQKLMKFREDGAFVNEWKGPPDRNFYGPRDLALGSNKKLYIVDQGQTRIVSFDLETESFGEWGHEGSGPGEFRGATGIAVSNDNIYVADAGNKRVQVFDLNGAFIRQWPVQWDDDRYNYPDVVFDAAGDQVLVTSGGQTNQLLAFDSFGIAKAGSEASDRSSGDNLSALAVAETGGSRRPFILNTGMGAVCYIDLANRPHNDPKTGRAKPGT
jgi:DNA-binding beta-propeller fold protein YncE